MPRIYFRAVTHVDLPLCNEPFALLDLVAGCGVTYIFAFGLFLLETQYSSVVWPFFNFSHTRREGASYKTGQGPK